MSNKMTIWSLFYLVIISDFTETHEEMSFIRRQPLCDLEEGVESGYIKVVPNLGVKHLDCARWCKNTDICLGFSYSRHADIPSTLSLENDPCFIHQDIKSNDNCSSLELDLVFYRNFVKESDDNSSKPEVYDMSIECNNNGGEWNDTAQTCSCLSTNYMVGDVCNEYPKTCKDLFNAGFKPLKKEVYLKPLDDEDKIWVKCIIFKLGYTMSIVANNGIVEETKFNRTWYDYENGFKDGVTYWMGLKYLRGMILSSNESKSLVVAVKKGFTTYGTVTYKDVQLSDSRDEYRMTYSYFFKEGRMETANDICTNVNGKQFSTFDNDNDGALSYNCAALNGAAGWWFGSSCHNNCNFFGSAYPPTTTLSSVVGNENEYMHNVRFPAESAEDVLDSAYIVQMQLIQNKD